MCYLLDFIILELKVQMIWEWVICVLELMRRQRIKEANDG
jgi:hypothetical protein